MMWMVMFIDDSDEKRAIACLNKISTDRLESMLRIAGFREIKVEEV